MSRACSRRFLVTLLIGLTLAPAVHAAATEADIALPTALSEAELSGDFNPEPENVRHFGVSLGSGAEVATGNRGALWKNAGPSFQITAHYWFDYPLALQLSYTKNRHSYQGAAQSVSTDVSNDYLVLDAKYAFSTHVAMPTLVLGMGGAFKSEQGGVSSSDRSFLMNVGLLWDLPISNRISVVPEWKYRVVAYDAGISRSELGAPVQELNGGLHTLTLSLLTSW